MSGEGDDLATLRTSPEVRWLNVGAVGCAIASASAFVIARALGGGAGDGTLGAACALSTLFWATAWARLVRVRRAGLPLGWLLSLPFAALNAGTALALAITSSPSSHRIDEVLAMVAAGAFVGVIVWFPALCVTLVLFGVPLAHAQRAAERGLSSEDRGERTVGVVAASVSLLAMLALVAARFSQRGSDGVLAVLALAGIALGTLAAAKAHRRIAKRDALLAQVVVGERAGLRIDAHDGVERLVRVHEARDVYRGAVELEPIAELRGAGEARAITRSQ